jgi:two-component system NtrC family response regulator
VLEDGSYYAVGDTRQRRADVRIVSATNRSLHEPAADSGFRADLYYRIATFAIALPALRERRADIPLLAAHFLAGLSEKSGKSIGKISKEAEAALCQYGWKGNIRELKHVLERAVILEDSDTLTLDSLPLELRHAPDAELSGLHLASVEQAHIRKVLHATDGNKAEAARLLNIGIATLYRKIEEYGLKEQPAK